MLPRLQKGAGAGAGAYLQRKREKKNILDETLVDAHLVAVPGLGTLAARSLTGGDLEGLGRQTDGALDAQVLALGALDDLSADLLEDGDLAGGEGDADLVGLLLGGEQKTSVSWGVYFVQNNFVRKSRRP